MEVSGRSESPSYLQGMMPHTNSSFMPVTRAEIILDGGETYRLHTIIDRCLCVVVDFRAHCIGANNSTATSLLRQDYKEDIGLEEALELAVKVLSKTMDSTTLDHEKGEPTMLGMKV